MIQKGIYICCGRKFMSHDINNDESECTIKQQLPGTLFCFSLHQEFAFVLLPVLVFVIRVFDCGAAVSVRYKS
jgi:hypothetical protein